MFIRKKGKTKEMWFPKKASTAFNVGDLVIFDGSGNIDQATSSTTQHVGVIKKKIASTDSDYASNTLVPVDVPIEVAVEWEVDTSSAVAGDVGTQCDLTDRATANRGASSHKVLTISKYVSATEIWVVINGLYFFKNGS